MKQYIQPKTVIQQIEIPTMFLTGSDPTINPNDESDDMEVKGNSSDNFGDYLW